MMVRSVGVLRGEWRLVAVHLISFLFFLGVFGTANAMLDYMPIPLILWVLPFAVATLVGVAAVGFQDAALDRSSRIAMAVRLTMIVMALGAGLKYVARALGNTELMVYGFNGPILIAQVLLPAVVLFGLNLAGIWLGGRIALSGER